MTCTDEAYLLLLAMLLLKSLSTSRTDHISPDDYILDPESPDGIGSRTSSNSIVRDRIGSCPAPESIAIDHINMYASRLLSLGLQ